MIFSHIQRVGLPDEAWDSGWEIIDDSNLGISVNLEIKYLSWISMIFSHIQRVGLPDEAWDSGWEIIDDSNLGNELF